ncbi:MAG: hypothetical protein U5K77_03315 [Candidatus Saccharibacteria bacterium]|nr:hypothetical protein [Candidatus Saccharibacteria bacterium]
MSEQQQKTNQNKEWYKHGWGLVAAILLFPYFLIWYAWAKSKWSKNVKIAVTAVVVVVMLPILIGIATTDTSTDTSSNSSQASNETTQAESEPAEQEESNTTTIDRLWVAADETTGRNNVEINFDESTGTAFLSYYDESFWDEEDAIETTYTNFVGWGKEIANISEVAGIEVESRTDFTDDRGETDEEMAVKVTMSTEKFLDYNWEGLEYKPIHRQIQRTGDYLCTLLYSLTLLT